MNPAVWLSSIRSVIRCSGWDSKALWTVKPGRYVVIGTSRSSRPDWTACITAVAVKTFDIDWTLKIVSTLTGVRPARSVEPNPCCHTTRSPSTSAKARPGMCCWAINSGILTW